MMQTVTKSSNLSASLAKLLAIVSAVAGLALISPASHAQNSLMASGQWKDPETGLIWMRCSIGQKWNGDTCTGKAIKLNWNDAREYPQLFNQQVAFGGKRNWRLPTIAELATIRYCSNGWARKNSKIIGNLTQSSGPVRTDTIPNGRGGTKTVPDYCETGSSRPTINKRIFPATVDSFYWSSSPYASNNNYAWGVYFNLGDDNLNNKNDSDYVRLVRGGQ